MSSERGADSSRRDDALGSTNVHAVLGRLSDAIAFVHTAATALLRAEEQEGMLSAGSVGNELVALQHGIGALRCAYDELDTAVGGTGANS